jgi:competence protein ComEA
VTRLQPTLLAAGLLLAAFPALAKPPLGPTERIDVAHAGVPQLMRLPGVGRKKAQAIVAYRKQHPFRSTSDLLEVKGVSAAWLDRNRGHLSVSTAPAAPAAPASARTVGRAPSAARSGAAGRVP